MLMQAEVYKDLAKLVSETSATMLIRLGFDEPAASVPWQSYFTIPG